MYQKGQVPLKMKGVTVPLWLVGQSLLCHCKRRLCQLFELLLVPHTHIRNLRSPMQFPKLHRFRLVYIFYFDGLQMDFEELLYF